MSSENSQFFFFINFFVSTLSCARFLLGWSIACAAISLFSQNIEIMTVEGTCSFFFSRNFALQDFLGENCPQPSPLASKKYIGPSLRRRV